MVKFWMIYVDGKTGSAHKHTTPQEAVKEAERLAKLPDNLGRKVYVLCLEAYCVAEVPPLHWVTRLSG